MSSMKNLEEARASVTRAGKLHWVHWAVISMSLVLTLAAWLFTKSQVEEKSQLRFEQTSKHVIELIYDRMTRYENALRAAVSAIKANDGEMRLSEWRRFAHELRIYERYPGINGIGVIFEVSNEDLPGFLEKQRRERPLFDIHPQHDYSTHFPITYIEPSNLNRQAIGYDMAHESKRRKAVLEARESGEPQITAPIILVQDSEKTPGFLLFVPYHDSNVGADDVPLDKRFLGIVYAPFIFKELIAGVLGQENRHVRFDVRDQGQILYEEYGEEDARPQTKFLMKDELELFGREWKFTLWESPDFHNVDSELLPTVILIGGLLIDGLLLVIFISLSHANRRAVRLADDMVHDLTATTRSLERSNADLEQFAHVASHDLRTPLRGLAYLIGYVEEDIQVNGQPDEGKEKIKQSIDRMKDQVKRMDSLIKGLLDYGKVGGGKIEVEQLDMNSWIDNIRADMNLGVTQLVYNGEDLVLHTDATTLKQVLTNLIENAVKYNDCRDRMKIEMNMEKTLPDRLEFKVTDNGPGIDSRFLDRIFEAFQQIPNQQAPDGVGIGLSIVKRAVERYGGSISVTSDPETRHTAFSFDWPINMKQYGPNYAV